MDGNAINAIVSLLPEKVIYDAACRHAIKLCQRGELEEAENLYKLLYNYAHCRESLGETARCLVAQLVARHEIGKAIHIYEHFPCCEKNCDMLAEKLKTCHFLTFALMPDHPGKAYEYWKEYEQYNLNQGLIWHWLKTGVALLEWCQKNSYREMAGEIFRAIKRYGNSETGKAFLQKAESIRAKSNR